MLIHFIARKKIVKFDIAVSVLKWYTSSSTHVCPKFCAGWDLFVQDTGFLSNCESMKPIVVRFVIKTRARNNFKNFSYIPKNYKMIVLIPLEPCYEDLFLTYQ